MGVDSLTIKRRGQTVLDGISFEAENEILGVAGHNGSGKTTLLRAIESAARKTDRRVQFGRARETRRLAVGHLPQAFSLPKALTVKEFVAYAAWVKNVADPRRAAGQAIASTRLVPFGNQVLGRVSGGVAQRAGFASVLVDDPEILLLDEPTTGVDIYQRSVMRDVVADQGKGRVTIISSHIAEDLEQLCDRVLVLGRGKVRFLGTIDEARRAAGEADISKALVALSGGPR